MPSPSRQPNPTQAEQLAFAFNPGSSWTQRWRDGNLRWQHQSGPQFEPRRYEVALVEASGQPSFAEFVKAHHYSGTYVADRLRFGLFDIGAGGVLVGAAVLSIPSNKRTLTNVFPHLTAYKESLELGRFVLLDEVPANAETWFLARAFKLAAELGVRGIVSFADPVPRTRVDQSVVFPGHVGTIYQAANAVYTGRGSASPILILPDGRSLNQRSISKVTKQESGHGYVEARLIEYGARHRRDSESPAAWLQGALHEIGARRMKHPGAHRYAFAIGRRAERNAVTVAIPQLPYPKSADRAPGINTTQEPVSPGDSFLQFG